MFGYEWRLERGKDVKREGQGTLPPRRILTRLIFLASTSSARHSHTTGAVGKQFDDWKSFGRLELITSISKCFFSIRSREGYSGECALLSPFKARIQHDKARDDNGD